MIAKVQAKRPMTEVMGAEYENLLTHAAKDRTR